MKKDWLLRDNSKEIYTKEISKVIQSYRSTDS